MSKVVLTVAEVLLNIATEVLAFKAKVKGFSVAQEGLALEIAKNVSAKASILAFENDDFDGISKKECLEYANQAISNLAESIKAKEALESAGAEAKAIIEKLAISVVAGEQEKSDALEQLAEIIPSAEFAGILLDKAITKEQNKIAFASTKSVRFVRSARQILSDSKLTDAEKMHAILNLSRARFTADENKAQEEALKAEAEGNVNKKIAVSREDGTSYEGTISAVATVSGTVSYRVKSTDGTLQLIGVAQRLSYDIIEVATEATEGAEENQD